jgi:hypothetical protein
MICPSGLFKGRFIRSHQQRQNPPDDHVIRRLLRHTRGCRDILNSNLKSSHVKTTFLSRIRNHLARLFHTVHKRLQRLAMLGIIEPHRQRDTSPPT